MKCFSLPSYGKNVHILIPLQSAQYSCTPEVIIQSSLAVLGRNFVYSQTWGTLFNKENWSFTSPARTCDFRLQLSKRVEIERASFEFSGRSSKMKMPELFFAKRTRCEHLLFSFVLSILRVMTFRSSFFNLLLRRDPSLIMMHCEIALKTILPYFNYLLLLFITTYMCSAVAIVFCPFRDDIRCYGSYLVPAKRVGEGILQYVLPKWHKN